MKQFQTAYRGENAFRTTVSEWQLHCAHKPVLIRLFSDGADPSEFLPLVQLLMNSFRMQITLALPHPGVLLMAGFLRRNL